MWTILPSAACCWRAGLIHHGFRTGLVAQPRWDSPDDLLVMGRPRLFAGVSAGALDSLLAHYTAFRKKRHDDAYTPAARRAHGPTGPAWYTPTWRAGPFPACPWCWAALKPPCGGSAITIFWTDALRRPILMDAKADLVWGMGERAGWNAPAAWSKA